MWLKSIHILLEETCISSTFRLVAADIFPPLIKRSNNSNTHTFLTEKIKLFSLLFLSCISSSFHKVSLHHTLVDHSAQEFSERIGEYPPWTILVFSNNPEQSDKSAGVGAAVFHRYITVSKVKVPLGTSFEVYDSETISTLAWLWLP